MGWIIWAVIVLVVSGVIGLHLGRFREAYTEMTGMMVGMMMGMLNGFLLGYAAAAATNSMFWGNLLGILLGLGMGLYFGRPGGLMGVMDGGMGGVMGGSMGAMLAVMIVFPREGLFWTAALLTAIYIAGMLGLVVLIERSAPDTQLSTDWHRCLPVPWLLKLRKRLKPRSNHTQATREPTPQSRGSWWITTPCWMYPGVPAKTIYVRRTLQR